MATTITYRGVDLENNTPLSPSGIITVNSITGSITHSGSVVRSYKIKIIGTLPNKKEIFQIYEVIAENISPNSWDHSPYFSSFLLDKQVFLKGTVDICLTCTLTDSSIPMDSVYVDNVSINPTVS